MTVAPVIITAGLTGSRISRERTPYIPHHSGATGTGAFNLKIVAST